MCLRFANRPCFIAADPTIFSPKIKKRECCPVLLEWSRILVPVFNFFAYSILFGYISFRFCQSKMVTFSLLFVSKNVITKIRKACLKQQVITRWLEIFNDNHPCDDAFLLWVYFPLLLLDVVSTGRKKKVKRQSFTNWRFIVYKNVRYVPFVQCLLKVM